jgi:hypothetical protein
MNYTKWDIDELNRAKINHSDAAYMSDYGMPNLRHDELEFSTGLLLPANKATDCHRIGTYGILNDLLLYVRESSAGVWTIDEATSQPVLVNSSARAFSNFIALREKYLLDVGKLLPATIQETFISVIKKAMEAIDPSAFSEGTVWGPFMEDICNQAAYYGEL